jgi:hypothetical protein
MACGHIDSSTCKFVQRQETKIKTFSFQPIKVYTSIPDLFIDVHEPTKKLLEQCIVKPQTLKFLFKLVIDLQDLISGEINSDIILTTPVYKLTRLDVLPHQIDYSREYLTRNLQSWTQNGSRYCLKNVNVFSILCL